MKVLHFKFRDDYYQVNEEGHIKTQKLTGFSPTWVFLGGSKHHWSNRINVSLKDAFDNPKLLEGCLGWDKDHGTTRQWGGSYNGKLPRISNVYVTEN
jgi:hypothetical protein